MAGRLSAAGHSVLLVEAGGSAPALVHVPGLVANLQRGVLDLYLPFFTFIFLGESLTGRSRPRSKMGRAGVGEG